MTTPPKKTTYKKTAMRLPIELHAEIESAAEAEGHSMNDEIIARLSAHTTKGTLHHIVAQNEATQRMIQRILDAISPRK